MLPSPNNYTPSGVPNNNPPRVGGRQRGGGADEDNQQNVMNNTAFNATLFQQYKDAPTSSRSLRRKISNNEIPQLPSSKVDQQPLCLAWHTKGMCNSNCRRPRIPTFSHVVHFAFSSQLKLRQGI